LEVFEHEIYKFLAERKDAMKISEVCEAFGQDRETRDNVREKLLMMARYGLIFIDGEYVSTRKILEKRTEYDRNVQAKPVPSTMKAIKRARILIN